MPGPTSLDLRDVIMQAASVAAQPSGHAAASMHAGGMHGKPPQASALYQRQASGRSAAAYLQGSMQQQHQAQHQQLLQHLSSSGVAGAGVAGAGTKAAARQHQASYSSGENMGWKFALP